MDITGQRFGKLTAVRLVATGEHRVWFCLCDCGGTRTTRQSSLVAGFTQSCGCLAKTAARSRPLKVDLTGQHFGCWTVQEAVRGTRHWLWKCLCDCGTVRVIQGATLRNGRSTSCGCLLPQKARERFVTHGDTAGEKQHTHGTKEYRAWKDAKARCHNPRHRWYRAYGAKGVTVCERWRDDFAAFLNDMGRCPHPDYSLDRIDPFGNYEPGNCRWTDQRTQATNTRRAKRK